MRGTFYTSLPMPCASCGEKVKRVRDTRMISLPDNFVLCGKCGDKMPAKETNQLLDKLGVTGLRMIE